MSETAQPEVLSCPLHEVDTFDPQFLQQPHPFYRRLRQEAPVFRDPKTGVVSVATYEHVMEALTKPRIFSNAFGAQLRAGSAEAQIDPEEAEVLKDSVALVDTMLTADPPDHTRYRKLAGSAFTFKKVMAMSEYVEGVVNELIDAFAEAGECEFKSQFGNLLPMYVICDALGFSREGRADYARWSTAFVLQLSGMADKEQRIWCARQVNEAHQYFLQVCEARRDEPREDIVSDLVHADLELDGEEAPRKLTDGELCSILQQILVAGNETTAHTLTTGLYYLLSHPEQMERLRADDSLIENFVEESLRMLTPTNNMWRVATEDTELGGVAISKGDMLLLRFGSANRDDDTFAEGDRFDITRDNARKHLAFGGGVHLCLGQQLARKEMATAFRIILKRLQNIRLADPEQTFMYVPSILLRGVVELKIRFDAA